jgi:carbonic anhydrase
LFSAVFKFRGFFVEKSLQKIMNGYRVFREKYAVGDRSVMQGLSFHGQKPEIMVVACCDSRVDPAVLLQCDPGDIFVVRNVANIIPPFEKDDAHHGTSAALEFGVRILQIKHLIIFGHSQCGGIEALLQEKETHDTEFVHAWVSLVQTPISSGMDVDQYAKQALRTSYSNCLTFPWIQQRIDEKTLCVHLWFFDIKTGKISVISEKDHSEIDL